MAWWQMDYWEHSNGGIMFTWKGRVLGGTSSFTSNLTKNGLGNEAGLTAVESSWNVMAHGDAEEGKWKGKRRMEWVASTLHTTSEHGVSSITTADEHTSAASSRLNWSPRCFKWTRPFRRKTKSGFCTCANLVSARVPSHFKLRLLRQRLIA
jgi:hypothetical protein